MEHRDVQLALADLAQGTLAPDLQAATARHLTECAECREWVATYAWLARFLGSGEAAHPSSDRLARHAIDPGAVSEPDRIDLDQHVAACDECRRFVTLAREAVGGPGAVTTTPPAERPPVTSTRWRAPLALAATLLVAFVGGAALWQQTRTLRQQLELVRSWSGPVGYVLLQTGQRSAGEVPRLILEAVQPHALVAVQLDSPPAAADVLRFRIARNGDPVWEATMPVAEARSRLATYDAIFFQVPAWRFQDGDYDLVVTLGRDGTDEPLLIRRFRIEIANAPGTR